MTSSKLFRFNGETQDFEIDDGAVRRLASTLLGEFSSQKAGHATLNAPRRRSKAYGAVAQALANVIYPDIPPLRAIIRYEKTIIELRKPHEACRKAMEQEKNDRVGRTHRERIRISGAWDPPSDFWKSEESKNNGGFKGGKSGLQALPMPVSIAKADTLAPFFDFLASNQAPAFMTNVPIYEGTDGDRSPALPGSDHVDDSSPGVMYGTEPYYGVDMIEFKQGVFYADCRMDLCKVVVGPEHIQTLMQCLRRNEHVRHFLLGNNLTGPGSKAIADFIRACPEKIETWYLAGNMIDEKNFETIVDAAVESPVIHSFWLKRNPLGPGSAETLFRLITSCPLRVLDLEQTELSDSGVASMFRQLTMLPHDTEVVLQTVYLNGTGASETACYAISAFLEHPACRLENLYLSNNPLGDRGAAALARGLQHSAHLRRLSVQSCGFKPEDIAVLIQALTGHPRLITLDIGQSIATYDLGTRYNWATDSTIASIATFLTGTPQLRYLSLGTTAFSPQGIEELRRHVLKSNLAFFMAASCFQRVPQSMIVRKRLAENVKREYHLDWTEFLTGELRWLRSPKDVRFIDSVYRNRDAALAKRGLKELKKAWDEDDSTMEQVLQYQGF